MKMIFFLLPFVIGALTVVQTILNRNMGMRFGWPVAGMINNSFGFLFALILVLVLSLFFAGKGLARVDEFKWWFFIPGCIGMLFVMGVPYSVHQIGASKTFILLVTSQILFGLLWDFWNSAVDGGTHSVSTLRLVGVGITLVGAMVVSLST